MSTLRLGHTSQNSTMLQEQRQQAKIDAMRARREDRVERFMDARSRTMGVDTAALDQQIAEKRARQKAERQAEFDYAKEQRRVDQVVSEYEKAVAAEKARRRAMDAEATRLAGQVVSETAALNDPAALRKDRPPRIGAHDHACGPSAAQVFDGEDARAGERRALQAAQMRRWVAEAEERRAAEAAAAAAADAAHRAQMEDVAATVAAYEEANKAEAARRTRAVAEENRAAAAEAAARRAADAKAEAAALATAHELPGLLDESVADRRSQLGASRVRPDTYRGQYASEAASVLAAQAEQAEAAAAKRLAERQADWEHARAQAEVAQQVARYEKAAKEEAERRRAQYKADLERQVAERRAAQAAEAAADKQSGFGDGFFSAFGRSDR